MSLYADENFPLRVVEELRRLGHNVLTALEDGKANQAITDADLLARASELNRVLVTLNRQDFKRLHLQMPDHAGIIICTEDPDRVGQAQRISVSIAEAVDLAGKLIRVYRPATPPTKTES
jgi:predicted nuclease of predicted toxin-antitoxin system